MRTFIIILFDAEGTALCSRELKAVSKLSALATMVAAWEVQNVLPRAEDITIHELKG